MGRKKKVYKKRLWTDEEVDYLINHADRKSVSSMAKELKRSTDSVTSKMGRLRIARFHTTTDMLSKHSIACMFQIDPRKIESWHAKGLKYRKIGHLYMHNQRVLIEWLHQHPDQWDATRGDMYIFADEKWFPDKLKADQEKKLILSQGAKNWNSWDARELVRLHDKGMSFEELGIRYKRTPLAVRLKYFEVKRREKVGRIQ